MREMFTVGLGGFLGSILRFKLSEWAVRFFVWPQFPVGTLLVNALGCFLIGIAGSILDHRGTFPASYRLLLVTGVLGGFTTFSAFSYETLVMAKRGQLFLALLYVTTSVVIGIGAAWVGFLLGGLRGT